MKVKDGGHHLQRIPERRHSNELAHSYTTHVCGVPGCGLHIIPERKNGRPYCEMILGRDKLQELLDYYDKWMTP